MWTFGLFLTLKAKQTCWALMGIQFLKSHLVSLDKIMINQVPIEQVPIEKKVTHDKSGC